MAMLKFIKNIHYGSNKSLSRSNSWFMPNYQMISLCSSTASASQPRIDKVNQEKVESSETFKNKPPSSSYSMTNFVFESLKTDLSSDKSKQVFNAKTVEDLLKISEAENISNKSILLIATTLNRWISEKKIVLADYEKDPRFQKVVRKSANMNRDVPQKRTPFNPNEIDNIMDTSNLTPDQSVRLLSGLAVKHTRMKPLIQSLLTIINNNVDKLTLKQTADVLFSMASLSFPHDELLRKICTKISKCVDEIEQSPIIGSIVTSLGMMRYRNKELMNTISIWIMKHKDIVRTRDACSFLLTLAVLGLKPSNFDVFIQELIAPLNITDMTTSLEWIDVVWALSILNRASPQHLESVLNNQFISMLPVDEEIPFVRKSKLQNINSVAKLLTPDYKGSFLNYKSPLFISPQTKNREKQTFIRAITDALANLFPSRDFFDANFMDDAGLMIDVIFYYDKKKGPIPVTEGTVNEKAIRIAVIANTFHDYCIGEKSLVGSVLLHYRLLQAQGYQIIDISYEDFNSTDKLLKRITYMNDRIKSVVKNVM
ncbi:FAST kinase domain-containing protein 4 [Chelonus insularis]|uniref:FAST kinase domain-containing protein 4 n=1 Tax=Chelonus insularis TaxID=460826 RepID=UPI001588AE60|nr:FAST kinase domain-containing protein 4 [Chelonus insularis]